MNIRRHYKVFILLILFLLIFLIYFLVNLKSNNKKLIDENNILKDFTVEEKNELINDLFNYLDNEKIVVNNELSVYKKRNINNNNYIYIKLNDKYNSIFECFKNKKYICTLLGNSVLKMNKSIYSNITYLELIDESQYKLEKELEELREKAKTSKPDGDLDWK